MAEEGVGTMSVPSESSNLELDFSTVIKSFSVHKYNLLK